MNTYEQDVQEAIFNLYPSVLNDFKPPRVVVDDAYCARFNVTGNFNEIDNLITIKSSSDGLTLAHEYGHWVFFEIFKSESKLSFSNEMVKAFNTGKTDWQGLAKSSQSAEAMIDLFDEARRTMLFVRLEKYYNEERAQGNAHIVESPVKDFKEVWANAFAQSLAMFGLKGSLRGNLDSTLQMGCFQLDPNLELTLAETNGYWTREEYEKSDLGLYVRKVIELSSERKNSELRSK